MKGEVLTVSGRCRNGHRIVAWLRRQSPDEKVPEGAFIRCVECREPIELDSVSPPA